MQPFPEGLVVENRVVLAQGRCVGRDRRVGYTISPTDPGRVVVSGRLAKTCPPQTQRLAIMDPAQYAFGTFVTLWREQGGEFRGGWLRAPTPRTRTSTELGGSDCSARPSGNSRSSSGTRRPRSTTWAERDPET